MLAAAVVQKKDETQIKYLQDVASGGYRIAGWQKEALQSSLSILADPLPTAASNDPGYKPLNEEEQSLFAAGRQLYLNTCSGCHGTNGEGLERFAPPLRESEWVLGNEKKLALILLHGMEGPLEVNGKQYDVPQIMPVMPSLSTIDDRDLAATLTYVRRAWGHQAEPHCPRHRR